MTWQTPMTVLPSASSWSAVLRLRMICAAVCLVRFQVEPPTQADRAERAEGGGAETGRLGGAHRDGAAAEGGLGIAWRIAPSRLTLS